MLKRLLQSLACYCLLALVQFCVVSVTPPTYLIARTQWNNFGSYSPTLTIYPTSLGRLLAAPSGMASLVGLHWVDQQTANKYWQAALASAGKYASPARTVSMHQQFNCHFYFASKNPIQDSWNIDTQRLPAPMNLQVLNTCNYPLLAAR